MKVAICYIWLCIPIKNSGRPFLEKTKDIINLMGIVMPVEWDEQGDPLEFALFTYDEQEFLIDPKSLCGKELAGILQQKIRVTGTLGKKVGKRRTIKVFQYESLSASDSGPKPAGH